MNTLDGLPILTHCKSLAATGKEQDALAILHEFFAYFDQDSPQDHLWYLLVMALQNDSDEIEARYRADMIFFYEYCLALFEAARALHLQVKTQKRRKKR